MSVADGPTPGPSRKREGRRTANPARANPARGEVAVAGFVLRPSFAALVAAEEEVGALFALVERAAAGGLGLAETVALLWHCRVDDVRREDFAEALAAAGIAALAAPLGALLRQIVSGR